MGGSYFLIVAHLDMDPEWGIASLLHEEGPAHLDLGLYLDEYRDFQKNGGAYGDIHRVQFGKQGWSNDTVSLSETI